MGQLIYCVEDDDNIREIEEYAFIECSKIGTVTLPSTLTEVVAGTFYNCSLLSTINLGDVEVIGASAFQGCSNLRDVDLANVVEIKDSGFNSSAIITVSLPKVKKLGVFAFYGSALSTISMPVVEYIDSYALSSIRAKTIDLPASLKTINASAFASNTLLETFTSSNSINITNDCFALDKGVLYVKNLSGKYTLETYPRAKKDTEYTISVEARDAAGNRSEKAQIVVRTGNSATGVHASTSTAATRKLIVNGQLYIQRESAVYNSMGQSVQ